MHRIRGWRRYTSLGLGALEMEIHVRVHFYDFAARGRVDKVVPDNVRPAELVVRVPEFAQE